MVKFRLNRQEKLLFLSPVLVLGFALFYRGSDEFDKAQRRLAGANAIDCGVGHLTTIENNTMYQNTSAASACAVAAFQAKKPYRVRYDTSIPDAADGPIIQSAGSVRTPQGQIYFFFYSRSDGLARWVEHEDCKVAICPKPVVYEKAVGCGTCAAMGCIDSASCLLP